jgi:hypothetical protein
VAITEAVRDLWALTAERIGIHGTAAMPTHLQHASFRRPPRLSLGNPTPWLLHVLCGGAVSTFAPDCLGDASKGSQEIVAAWAAAASRFYESLVSVDDAKFALPSTSRGVVLSLARRTAANARDLLASCSTAASEQAFASWLRLRSRWGHSAAYGGQLPSWFIACTSTAVDLRNGSVVSQARASSVVDSGVLSWNTAWQVLWDTAMPPVDVVVNGEIAQDFYGTFRVSGGGSDSAPPASSGADGAITAPRCPAGLGGLPRCTPCGCGFWRNGSLDAPYFCSSCSGKPSVGIYIDAQATGPNCA